MTRILVVSPDRTVPPSPGPGGFPPLTISLAATAEEGVCLTRRFHPRLILAASHMSDCLALVREGRQTDPPIPVVVVSENLSTAAVFEAAARGAYDVVVGKLGELDLRSLLERMNGDSGPSRRCRAPVSGSADEGDEDVAVGRCPQVIEAFKTAGSAAPTDATVLIRGESGTGKDLMARAIHRASARPGMFVAVNCAAVVEGLAESELFGHERGAFTGATDRRAGCLECADGGTLFLDEIGEATPAFQAKLLRALDRGEFYRVGGRTPVRSDVRVVAATNRDLEAAVEAGSFRADLFYRLTEVSIHLPAVRERQEDIPQLVGRLLSRIARRLNRRIAGVSEEALVRLVSHRWPGNVREMQNVLTRAVLVCRGDTIQARHLAGLESGPAACPGVPTLEAVEREHIRRVLEAAAWNRGRTCEILGITRPTLRRKMRAYRITSPFDDEIDGEGCEDGLRLDSPGGSGHDSPAAPAGPLQALTG